MPYLKFTTNVPQPADTDAFFKAFSTLLSDTFSKPLEYCMVGGTFAQHLYMKGTADPAVHVELDILNAKDADANVIASKAIADFFKSHLGVDSDRIFFVTRDIPPHHWGYLGSTIAKLFE